jgi:hypothetical protein
MPTATKPLFRPEALRPRLSAFTLPSSISAAYPKLQGWANLLAKKEADKLKETELLREFVSDVFIDLLGYTGLASGQDRYTVKREKTVEVEGKFADAALGQFFVSEANSTVVAALEGKGPRDPLDRPFAGRKLSAVDQALHYAVNLVCDWYLVTNLREIRLYHKGQDQFTFERFETAALVTNEAVLRRFVFLLGAERMVRPPASCHLDELLSESRRIRLELTRTYYREYAALRCQTFERLWEANPDLDPSVLLTTTQKILDRVLFIAFCQCRGLLPADSIAMAYRHADLYNPRPIWDNFQGLFRAVNEGNGPLGIERYNGGLFAPDALLESLKVPNDVCQAFDKLAAYNYRLPSADSEADGAGARLIDVEILGHIFEQSITHLEDIRRAIAAGQSVSTVETEPSKRKREGAFYTPSFITRHIVAATLGPVLKDRFEMLRQRHHVETAANVRRVLENPSAYDVAQLRPSQHKALAHFWDAWLDELATLRIVDPACGSGAFLIEAFEQLHAVYREAHARYVELHGPSLFDFDRQILQNNLYGVDLNSEAVEICRLSLWIKTAQMGKVLTSLDHNIQIGNSVVADVTVHPQAIDWRATFAEVFAAGGFDVVIGNPPYVRQEWISEFKPYLQQHYQVFDSVADLYVYFYERGVEVLKPGGRLGFVATNKWMKAGYGEPLRRFLADRAWVESVVDFGHAKQIFEDADVFPSILIVRKPSSQPAPATARVCAIPREQIQIDDLSRQIEAEGVEVTLSRLGAGGWSLEPPGVVELLEKIRQAGVPLKEFAGVQPLMGIKTGFNEAFLMPTPAKERLIAAEPQAAALLRPYLRGQDLTRWQAEHTGLWMLALKSSGNHPWPWAGAGDQAEAILAATYPAIYEYLARYRDPLVKRQDQGEYWWELRACAYWHKFEQPKILYQDITWEPSFCLDLKGTLANNTTYFLPTCDRWVLATLNSPPAWWFAWRAAQHGKDEALRFFTTFMEGFPIPQPTDEMRRKVEEAVDRLAQLASQRQTARCAVLDWLRAEFAVEKPSQKLHNLEGLDRDALVVEVKKGRGTKKPLSVAGLQALTNEHVRSILPMHKVAEEAQQIERQVGVVVCEAYQLTPAEVTLMWRTAPPRMPGAPSG